MIAEGERVKILENKNEFAGPTKKNLLKKTNTQLSYSQDSLSVFKQNGTILNRYVLYGRYKNR